jgi:hypothetical protein
MAGVGDPLCAVSSSTVTCRRYCIARYYNRFIHCRQFGIEALLIVSHNQLSRPLGALPTGCHGRVKSLLSRWAGGRLDTSHTGRCCTDDDGFGMLMVFCDQSRSTFELARKGDRAS